MSGGGSGLFSWGSNRHHGIGGSPNHMVLAARAARNRSTITDEDARRMIVEATAAELKERGIKVPTYSDRPMSQTAVFWCGFLGGLMLGLFVGLVFWELT
jgi:hypothetical protein